MRAATRKETKMYHNIKELLQAAEDRKEPLWRVILIQEQELTQKTEEEIFAELSRRYQIMKESAERYMKKEKQSKESLIDGLAYQQYQYSKQDTLCGERLNKIMSMAFSCSEVNATMGKICAAPTAGSCGILPATLIGISQEYGLTLQTTLEGLLIASGIGAIITRNATVSGAEGGCQAECGSAAAMAAAALVHMRSGSNEAMVHAAAFAFIHIMGLICDPVAGMVQVPCAFRNASGAINALLSADLALSGARSLIPPDEVIEAMYQVGKGMPKEFKETSLGGIAAAGSATHYT